MIHDAITKHKQEIEELQQKIKDLEVQHKQKVFQIAEKIRDEVKKNNGGKCTLTLEVELVGSGKLVKSDSMEDSHFVIGAQIETKGIEFNEWGEIKIYDPETFIKMVNVNIEGGK